MVINKKKEALYRMIDFQTAPEKYHHWKLQIDGQVARLWMDVDEDAGLFDGYQLKLNSYDLGVDIELADVIRRFQFEHPEVKSVVLSSAKDKVFCAGANIRMLAGASHTHKVNFCKFTNETRNNMEDSAQHGQTYIAAVNGACAGGGYELALACEQILLVDDGTASVALPEVPLLAVLPGTGGLTRVTDKRKVRRDRADVFSTLEEGIKGEKAVEWRLVDQCIATSQFQSAVDQLAEQLAQKNLVAQNELLNPLGANLQPLNKTVSEDEIVYSTVKVDLDRNGKLARVNILGADDFKEPELDENQRYSDQFWLLRLARELDDAILHLRFNELELGVICFSSKGSLEAVAEYDRWLNENRTDWFAAQIKRLWLQVLKRIDLTSRSLISLVEPDSCFAGFLSEILFASDRIYMADDEFEDFDDQVAYLQLSESNQGNFPMSNGLTRLQTRFLGEPEKLETIAECLHQTLDASEAERLGLVTEIFDEIDWQDEIRIILEERSSFSADAMTAMEANLRFAGPETMETRIFGRLTAWQNWIFQRPNAVGQDGALRRYGTGQRPEYNPERV